MRTVVWEQLLDGIAVFGGTFISHTTRKGELISLSSQFHPSPVQAASKNGTDRASLIAQPPISATKAVVLAVQNMGEELDAAVLTPVGGGESGPEQHQKFKAPGLKGDTDVKLIWLPIDQNAMRLCWDITLMSRKRGEMFREIVDAQTGQLWVRRCLTSYLSDASYRVYTSDSPSPFSPGWQTPSNP